MLGQPEPPAALKSNPYLPGGPEPLIFDQFQGINTSPLRVGVDERQCYWLDGFFPVAPRNLRTLPGIGASIYAASPGTIVCFAFYNIGVTPYAVVFLTNGSAIQVNINTLATTIILPAASIPNPSIVTIGTSQWGNQYLIIVTSGAPNGYWLWDGAILYASGTLGPGITITNVGSGYSTVPSVVVTGGHGSGVVIAAAISNGQVTGATIVNPGSGYLAGDTVSLAFLGGTSAGSGGTLTAVLQHLVGSGASITVGLAAIGAGFFGVTSTSVVAAGSGYSSNVALTVSGGPVYTNRNALLTASIVGGAVSSVQITYSGIYTNTTPLPTVTITDNGVFTVSSVTVNSAGSGYSPSTKVTATGGGAPITAQAALTPVITGGTITSVTVASPGAYGSNTPPTLTVSDTATVAQGTAMLMPFAVNGTAVETYAGHVWVVNGLAFNFTAPGSVVDFSTSNGGGNFTVNESYVKVGYSQLLNANGFLWLIGDSSVDYISGVQTSGSPPTTTYTKQNADPQMGSPYPASVELFGHDVLMANAVGVHVVNGSNVNKISEPLDGVWNTVANFGGLSLSSAQCYVFGKKVWSVLAKIVDPVSGVTANKLFLWHDKKWFPTPQDVTLTFIKHQELNSVITAYGTDGINIYPLFTTPSVAFQKTAQSRLWDTPGGYLFTKDSSRLWAMANYTSTLSPNLIFKIDAVDQTAGESSQTYTITGPTSTGYFITPPEAIGQSGQLTGLTVQTNAADMSLASVMLGEEVVQYRG